MVTQSKAQDHEKLLDSAILAKLEGLADSSIYLRKACEQILENQKKSEPSPSKKELKKYSDSAPLVLFHFALAVANMVIFLLNSRIVSEAISKVFNLDGNDIIGKRNLDIIKESVVFVILILFSGYLLFVEFKSRQEAKDDSQSKNREDKAHKEKSPDEKDENCNDKSPSTDLHWTSHPKNIQRNAIKAGA